MAEAALRAAPAWVAAAGAIIRRLPRGRYRVMQRLPRVAPFAGRLGSLVFVCDLGDDIAREVCFTGQYAPQETRLVREWLRPGATFVDVGANWGYFALLAAERVGPAGRVVALEPDARVFARLEENVARNRLDAVLPLSLAAAEGAGTARLARYAEGTGNRGVSSLELRGEGVAVATDALDAVLDRAGVHVADLVKIDVEGAESRVVQGMRDGLARGRYRRVMIELHPGIVPGVTAQVTALMRGAGYTGYWVDHSPEATRRFAYGRAGLGEVLTPVDEAGADDRWPHQVWLAPGVTR